MKKLILCLLVLLCCGMVHSVDVLLREKVQGSLVSISANGNAIVVLLFDESSLNSSKVTVFKRVALTYHKIEVKELTIFVPDPQRFNKPRLTDDGLYLYFINSATGFVTKGSLINTSPKNPYIELIHINNHGCQYSFQCKIAVSGDYVAFYSHRAKVITITHKDSTVVFNNSIINVRYPYYPEFQSYYRCNYYYICNNISGYACYNYSITNCSSLNRSIDNLFVSVIMENRGYNLLMDALQVSSVALSKGGNIMVLGIGAQTQYYYHYYYSFNFATNSFNLSTLRKDFAPEVSPQGGFTFWWSTLNDLELGYDTVGYIYVIDKQKNLKIKRPKILLYTLEGSKDKKTTQGYSIRDGSQYLIQLIQAQNELGKASNNYYFEPDLKIVGQQPLKSFDLNEDGSIITYLSVSTIVVVKQTLGVPEVFYHSVEKNFKQTIIYFSFASVLLLLIGSIVVLALYIKRRCRSKKDSHKLQKAVHNTSQNQTNDQIKIPEASEYIIRQQEIVV